VKEYDEVPHYSCFLINEDKLNGNQGREVLLIPSAEIELTVLSHPYPSPGQAQAQMPLKATRNSALSQLKIFHTL
jgi:hypothetical protein